jgi:hypothetical protein
MPGLQPQPPAVRQAEKFAEPPMRWAGTPVLLARRCLLMPMGLNNSSASISPGETGASSFSIISPLGIQQVHNEFRIRKTLLVA